MTTCQNGETAVGMLQRLQPLVVVVVVVAAAVAVVVVATATIHLLLFVHFLR